MAADIALGITLTGHTSGFSVELTDLDFPEENYEMVKTTHQGTTEADDFDPVDIPDNGELGVSFHYDPSVTPPVGTKQLWTLQFPAGHKYRFRGTMYKCGGSGPLNGLMTGQFAIKVSSALNRLGTGSGSGTGTGA